MPDDVKNAKKAAGKGGEKVFFTCQCCGKRRPLEQMRSVTRFVPVLIVCRECQKILR